MPSMTTKKVTVNEGQSLMDLAIQEYGGIEGIFDLMEDNVLPGIQVKMNVGQILKVYKEKASDSAIKDFYTQRGVTVNTRGSVATGDFAIPDMEIGNTFIIR
jgi:hypothetical protein